MGSKRDTLLAVLLTPISRPLMNNIFKIIIVLSVLAVLLLGANYFYQKSNHVEGKEIVATTPAPEATQPSPAQPETTASAPEATPSEAAPATAEAPKGIEAAIEAYIKAHPEVIIDSVAQYQQNQASKQIEQSEKYISTKWEELINDSADPIAGNPKGDVTIVEFFDYSCGYCKHVLPHILKILETDSNVKFVFKEFPILSANSDLAAKAALAVHMINPDKYLDFHKALFNVKVTSEASIVEVANNVGLDSKAVLDKIKAPEIQTILNNNRQFAFDAGIRGTPAFIINGKLIPGVADLETLQGLIKNAREKK